MTGQAALKVKRASRRHVMRTAISYLRFDVTGSGASALVQYQITSSTAGVSTSYSSSDTASAWSEALVAMKQQAAWPDSTILPVVTGVVIKDQILSVDTGTWSATVNSYAYRWQRSSDGSTWANIAAATANTYTLVSADVGSYVRAIVAATNETGTSTVPTVKTVIVTGVAFPVNLVLPVVTGTYVQGNTLTTTNGSWSGSPSSFAYQWYRTPNVIPSGVGVLIGGATNQTYVLTSADATFLIYVEVTATNGSGSTAADSVAAGPSYSAPVNVVLPLAAGDVSIGSTISTDDGTWTNQPTSITYQWQTSVTGVAGWSPLAGATTNSYTIQQTDLGMFLRCAVTAHNPAAP